MIRIPKYSLCEELINSISHGIGAAFSIWGIVMLILKAKTPLAVVSVSIYGATLIFMYTISCLYHALPPHVKGKKVLRVLDHCNVYLLVLGTVVPVSLLGIGGNAGWLFFSLVLFVTILGIVMTAINIDKFQLVSVMCHLLNGWSVIVFIKPLLNNIGYIGVMLIIIGGIMYSIGACLYGIGAKKKYMHSIFHFFCLAGSLFHYLAIYFYLL
jgi:hemolysin III